MIFWNRQLIAVRLSGKEPMDMQRLYDDFIAKADEDNFPYAIKRVGLESKAVR